MPREKADWLWTSGKSAFCVKEVNGDKPLRPAEVQPQILYLSSFCITPVAADGSQYGSFNRKTNGSEVSPKSQPKDKVPRGLLGEH